MHSPFALSSAVITSSSKAMLTSSSTKLLNVSFMVRVLSNREANGSGGFNSKSVADQKSRRGREREERYLDTIISNDIKARFNENSQKASSPSSSPSSSADDPEAVGDNSSFHFLLFFGGASARDLSCLCRGFWLWETEEGSEVKPSRVFT